MTDIILQPTSVYIGLAITSIFSGLGIAIGSTVTKIYIEPRLKAWKKHIKEHKLKNKIKEVFRK